VSGGIARTGWSRQSCTSFPAAEGGRSAAAVSGGGFFAATSSTVRRSAPGTCQPLNSTPLMKTMGVKYNPRAYPSSQSARTRRSVSGPFIVARNSAGSNPIAPTAAASSLSVKFPARLKSQRCACQNPSFPFNRPAASAARAAQQALGCIVLVA